MRRAKSLVMEYLDTRSNRVTLKMDVSYTDHSHVIGKGGEKRTEEVFYLLIYWMNIIYLLKTLFLSKFDF